MGSGIGRALVVGALVAPVAIAAATWDGVTAPAVAEPAPDEGALQAGDTGGRLDTGGWPDTSGWPDTGGWADTGGWRDTGGWPETGPWPDTGGWPETGPWADTSRGLNL
ncbi:MAG: hypothetical protein ACK4YP_03110 [Myxococcota bacterium]